MKYVLYGLPCSGKTTLLNQLSIPVIHGSAELNKMSDGKFSELSDNKKKETRIRYTEILSNRDDTFISDGHYSFLDDVVYTESDGNLYDVFLYLYCDPEIIQERIALSQKNAKFNLLSVGRIRKWQDYEIEQLRNECHLRNKDFYVVKDLSSEKLQNFIDRIENGFSSYAIAYNIVNSIVNIYPNPCELHICDGDKTIIKQDSFKVCKEGYVTHTFDGNFYTGYQALKFTEETINLQYDLNNLSSININNDIYDKISNKCYIILSSGITQLWESLSKKLNLKHVIANTLISADTKYFVIKLLQNKGYKIIAYGNGKNDYYMLKQSNQGYLYIGSYLSHSLINTDLSGIKLIYNKAPYVLDNINDSISNDILICKSNSGINGYKLANSHIILGKELGRVMKEIIPNYRSSIIVLERGGRFFGDGVYTGFGGVFYSYNPKNESIPNISSDIVVIVDSVINTGKSILNTISLLKKANSNLNIIIATNVIQEKALELLKEYKIFAVRVSSNSFIGIRQNEQRGGIGPDTADRLFNYIE